ncbi:MAG TPA: AtpZ/AtpI family protein [Bacteroidales bacterium]|jgi:F0F1-type ATP synthase assembly protein I|nr:MAG: putative F0F1-ATPase [Bacteroidetes bacterium ADurb.Bin145]HOU00992.1 AtpZ/AtpI family protein [Bacteroidales bacterium]HQK66617.1 AtpZ/AtpI family protein [Bacteroidales bacterium]
MEEQDKEKKPTNPENKGLSSYAKYSGIAFQMIAIIVITAWGGIKLDELAGNRNPVFTIILSLLGVFAAIYFAIKDFIKFK